MKRLITSVSGLLLALTAVIVHAENTRYNIEVVIFEDSNGRYLNSEQWPIIHHPEDEFALDATTKKSGNKRKQPNSDNIMELTRHDSDALSKHVAKLNQSERYNVLLHKSWQQAGLKNTDAISIQVDTSGTNKTGSQSQQLESSLQGTLKLVLGRYLHIHTDLLYKRFNNSDMQMVSATDGKIFSEFRIQSQRRMRSKELHYIDHPLLGMLVLVTPIEETEAAKN